MTNREVAYEMSLLGLLPASTLALIFADARRLAEKPAEALRAQVEAELVTRSEPEQYHFCAIVAELNKKF